MSPLPPSTTCLCVTHSPLVTRVARAALASGELPMEQVAWLGLRSTPLPPGGVCLDAPAHNLGQAYRKAHRNAYQSALAGFRDIVADLTGGPFTALLPHNNEILYQELLTLPECRGYCFVEEGFTSMTWRQWPTHIKGGRKGLAARWARLWTGSHYDARRPMFDVENPRFRGAFAISPGAFAGLPGRTDVSAHLPPLPEGQGPPRIYAALDSSYVHRGIAWNDYLQALLQTLRTSGDGTVPILVKFHFADREQPPHFRELEEGCARLGLPAPALLDASFCIEDALSRRDLLVFGVSSLGYYAALWGGKVRTFAPAIRGWSLEDWISRGLLPPDFDKVTGRHP